MSDYTKLVDFAGKDGMVSGNPLKVIQGREINDEFVAIATAVGSKANLISAQLTGLPVAPTAVAGTDTPQLATTAYVMAQAALTAAAATTGIGAALPLAGGTMVAGSVIANFESTGIDDNATSTAVTISDSGVLIGSGSLQGDLTIGNAGVAEIVVWSDTDNNGDANAYINFGYGGTSGSPDRSWVTGVKSSGSYIIASRDNNWADTGDTPKLEINSAGNVGIGATLETDWHSGKDVIQLGLGASIYGDTTATGTQISANARATAGSTLSGYKYISADKASTYHQYDGTHSFRTAILGAVDGAITWKAAMTIDNGGNVTALGNVTAYSDERLKSNIETIPDALEKILSIRGVNFDMNGVRGTGVIAQDLEQVLPEAVFDNEETELKSVAYGNVVGLLIEAIKEQQIQIDNLMYLIGED